MYSRSDGEKKGVIPVDQREMAAQMSTYNLLKNFQSRSLLPVEQGGAPFMPAIQPFTTVRKPLLAGLLANDDLDFMENVDPKLVRVTTSVRLTRDEAPMAFDVISLSRNVAEEETTLAQLELVQARDPEEGDNGGESGGEDEGGE